MNYHAVRAIYTFEMARMWRTLLQSIISPVLSTSLYFVVFGTAKPAISAMRQGSSPTTSAFM